MSQTRTIELVADGAQLPGRQTHVRTIRHCKGCDQLILWCLTAKNHKALAFDNLTLSGQVSLDGLTETVSTASVHFASCPQAGRFRR